MRWSPCESTPPPRSVAPPSINRPSGRSSTAAPSARSIAAVVAMRSDSLTRSSSASQISVGALGERGRPLRSRATHRAPERRDPPRLRTHAAARSERGYPRPARPETSRSFSSTTSAPIARNASTIPARVGLTPTAGSVRSEPGTIAAATIQNAAALMSPGTCTSRGRSVAPGRTRTVAPSGLDPRAHRPQHPLSVVAARADLDDLALARRIKRGRRPAHSSAAHWRRKARRGTAAAHRADRQSRVVRVARHRNPTSAAPIRASGSQHPRHWSTPQ